jgi:rhodanese-related sulfurtransferase
MVVLVQLGLCRQLPDRLQLEAQYAERQRHRTLLGGYPSSLQDNFIHSKSTYIMKQRITKIGIAGLVCASLSFLSCEGQVNLGNNTPTTVGNGTVTVTAAVVQPIEPAAAEKLMGERDDLQILDVRTPEEIAGGVIGQPTKINWYDDDFASEAEAALDKARPVIVYCKAGGRSAQAADLLVQKGYTQVYNLQGGFTRWQDEGRAVQE